ncbi:hypothetical protein [Natroniella sp. ANB-PHB2]|uniref:hypothetical protein n=1 Tax=Natroniella sp. ANB-PHB2 TaxID=3384444 RepID=UPI0038D3AE9D
MVNRQKIIILFLVIIMARPVYAQQGDFELGGGLSYNTVGLDKLNHHLWQRNQYLNYDLFSNYTYQPLENIESEVGYFLTGRYWLTDNLALGGEIEQTYLFSYYHNFRYLESYELELTGFLGVLNYRIDMERSDLDLKLAVGPYSSLFDWNKHIKTDMKDVTSERYEGNTLGAKIGADFFFPMTTQVEGRIGVNYRYAFFSKLEDEEGQPFYSVYGDDMAGDQFDFSGLEMRSSLEIKF